MKNLILILIVGLVLYPGWMAAQSAISDTLFLTAFSDSILLDEVVVNAGWALKSNSRWNDMKPVDLVTIGGTNGNLYQALQTLPGMQVQGESGKLLVRGGSSAETQTYIDGMHVLNPYTTTGENTPARGRYSTFMFSGINLTTGGQSQEYGEALSAVLPLETKDYSTINKIGINPSTVGVGGGGTHAFTKGSLSLNLDYQNMAPYYKIFSNRIEFKKPYQMFSGATQFRYMPDEGTVFKLYVSYDRTDFSNNMDIGKRIFDLSEDNMYLNTTFRKRTSSEWNWFAGVAYSYYSQRIMDAVSSGDHWTEVQQELHLKMKLYKRFNSWLRIDLGAESFLRCYDTVYLYDVIKSYSRMTPTVEAVYASMTFNPVERLKVDLSFRTEYTSLNREMNSSPRIAIVYSWNDWLLSATIGRYTQLPGNKYLVRQESLLSESCWQYNSGIQYAKKGRLYKVEAYYKKYNHLAWLDRGNITEEGYEGGELTSKGYGTSKGFDLFFDDQALLKNFEYQIAYSFNLSKRKYEEYAELTIPQYATRHNVAVVVKYTIPQLHTIIGITERFSSGRPYHNPDLPGLMNDEVKPFNSLDLGVTWLISKKVIFHASAINMLNRKNEFGKNGNRPVLASTDHFFYLGVFITLGKKAAYDVSNF